MKLNAYILLMLAGISCVSMQTQASQDADEIEDIEIIEENPVEMDLDDLTFDVLD